MTLATRQARLSRAVLSPATFGEPVTLPNGTVQAIVDLEVIPVESAPRGSNVGSRVTLRHQAPPTLWLSTADAAGLAEMDTVTVREVDYTVALLSPDGDGMTEVALAHLGAEPDPLPEERVWR